MQQMTAVRLHGPSNLQVETVPHPGAPAAGEVLLRITATGVCGSDLHPYETGTIGSTVLESPLVLGHEFAGVVESVGEGVALPLGTRVAVDPLISCGRCDGCEGGNPNLCRSQSFAGLAPTNGSLCQWMRVPARNCFPISDRMSDAEAALLEPLGIALHATDLARIRVGSSVAIFGAGPIGLCLTQTVKVAGANPIYVAEPLGWRMAAAQKLGALPLPPKAEVDVAIEAAWARESVQQAMDALRPGGTLVLVGIPFEDHVEFKHSTARRKGLTILMCRRMKRVYPRTIALSESGLVDLKGLITHRYPLTQVPEAFRMNAAYEDEVIKTVIEYPPDMNTQYVIGLDYGTNSVRALIVNAATGAEVGTSVWSYAHGNQGIILARDPNLARQHPEDYLQGAESSIKTALEQAKNSVPDFLPAQVIGIGVDTTGSTPLPVDESGTPLVF